MTSANHMTDVTAPNQPKNTMSLGTAPSENPKSLLSLIPDTFEGHLEMYACDPALLSLQQRRALVLHEKRILRKHRQVGALLRAIASTGPYWTPERAQKDRQYWTDSAKLMPGMTVQELKVSLTRRLRESTVMTPEKIAWKNPEWRPGKTDDHRD